MVYIPKAYSFMELSDDPEVKKKIAEKKKKEFDKKNPPEKIKKFKEKFADHLSKEKTKKKKAEFASKQDKIKNSKFYGYSNIKKY